MTHTIDAVARAYATVGLRSGCSDRELKTRYRTLVRTWHPDRWTNDPIAHADAVVRMRAINDAYNTLLRARAVSTPVASAPRPEAQAEPERPRASAPSRPLTPEEIEEIVHAIGNEDPLGVGLRFLAWFAPMGAALIPIMTRRNTSDWGGVPIGPTARDWAISGALFLTGVTIWVIQRLHHND